MVAQNGGCHSQSKSSERVGNQGGGSTQMGECLPISVHGAGVGAGRQRALLQDMLEAAIDRVRPEFCVPPHLPPPPPGRTIVVGAGKAAAAMAKAVEDNWNGPLEGVVVTRYGHTVPCRFVDVLEAGHPVPDEGGVAAARRILDAVEGLAAEDLVIFLASGGGSALLPAPPPGITLADERALTDALLKSGAPIGDINCVRKHISLIKAGRLAAAAAPAKVWTIAISDVPGDDPGSIASGPTIAGKMSNTDAIDILRRWQVAVPEAIGKWLAEDRSVMPSAGSLADGEVRLAASSQHMLEAAAECARDAGYGVCILGSAIEGEAREVGIVHAAIARQCQDHGQPADAPCVLLSGGETTVTIADGHGRGGRNVEFLLGLVLALDGVEGVSALAVDSDGIDGSEDNAGAIIDASSLERARELGLDAREYLARHDAYSFFSSLGDLVMTGPTLTNVNDFRAIVVERMRTQQEP